MEDMKLVEALNDLRAEVKADNAQLRREVREDMREVRENALQAQVGLQRKLIWAIMVLGLALGGKDLVALALKAVP
jgi:argininosuccinate lyase